MRFNQLFCQAEIGCVVRAKRRWVGNAPEQAKDNTANKTARQPEGSRNRSRASTQIFEKLSDLVSKKKQKNAGDERYDDCEKPTSKPSAGECQLPAELRDTQDGFHQEESEDREYDSITKIVHV